MKITFIFPGQGSQHVDMGKDLREKFSEVKARFRDASDALGYDVSHLCFEGPQEELNRTSKTQSCILTVSPAAFTVFASKVEPPSAMAGHILGEYPAFFASGVLFLRDALFWKDSVLRIIAAGLKVFVELGPGKGPLWSHSAY